MTEIVEGQGVDYPGNFNLCKDVVSNCLFCINY